MLPPREIDPLSPVTMGYMMLGELVGEEEKTLWATNMVGGYAAARGALMVHHRGKKVVGTKSGRSASKDVPHHKRSSPKGGSREELAAK
ncbi:unnamed protein product [Calypogeia fissa]